MGLTYPCYCSRNDVLEAIGDDAGWRRDPDGAPLYPGLCRCGESSQLSLKRAQGVRPAIRLKNDEAVSRIDHRLAWRECGLYEEPRDVRAEPQLWGDAVIGRRDIGVSYHIAVVMDDAAQGVSDVMRGGDLFSNTSLHRLLQDLLGLPAPVYHHHPLVRDAEGAKLSKSAQSKSLRAFRAEGASPRDIYEMIGLGDVGAALRAPTDRPPRAPSL
jgi:glutamyl-Q tRNA(Asp) synthetase